MVRTINLNADIPADRVLHISLPPDVPTGPAEVVLVVSTPLAVPIRKLGDLLESECFGMWRDREDIVDSVRFARAIREEGWKRPA